jgi:hypothetical protein
MSKAYQKSKQANFKLQIKIQQSALAQQPLMVCSSDENGLILWV